MTDIIIEDRHCADCNYIGAIEEVLPIPLDGLVLIKVDKLDQETIGEQKSAAGIIIRSSLAKSEIERHEDGRQTGRLVSIASEAEAYFATLTFRPNLGDHVYFKRYSGIEFRTTDNTLYRIMNHDDIWAVLPENYTAGVKQSV